jgi:hypothetical protein
VSSPGTQIGIYTLRRSPCSASALLILAKNLLRLGPNSASAIGSLRGAYAEITQKLLDVRFSLAGLLLKAVVMDLPVDVDVDAGASGTCLGDVLNYGDRARFDDDFPVLHRP